MGIKYGVFIISIVLIIFLIYWFFLKKENIHTYRNSISLYRHEQANFFKRSAQSPFILKKIDFTYLDYYPIDTKFRTNAQFIKNTTPDTLTLAMNEGSFEKFIIIGKVSFQLNKKACILLVFAATDSKSETGFIPYLDKTNGLSTYGGGRYLDIDYSNENTVVLDFNKSYNPYCAYAANYICPLPPKENKLLVAVEAGEKSYKH